jgi:HemY protein
MKGLIWFLVVAACAVGLALLARVNEGYLLLVAPPWRIEISLVLSLVLLLAGFALAYSLLRLVLHTLRLPAYVARFRAERRARLAREALQRAWRSYFEGRFGHALQQASRCHELGETPGLAALLAARCAHFLRDAERRELWLARAEDAPDDDRNARLATQAELLLDERDFGRARDVLRELHGGGPRHVATLRMMLRAEQGLGHWDEVLRLARLLDKRGAIEPERARQFMLAAGIQRVREHALDLHALKAFWHGLDLAQRTEPRIAAEAARAFISLGDPRSATTIVHDLLERHWDEALLELWPRCIDTSGVDRLEHAERWLREHARDALLLRVLGQLCVERSLWGKAQSYFEASLSTQESREAHIELARLLDRLERTDEANRHYRTAATL